MIGKREVYFFQSFKVIYSLNKIYKKNIKIGKVSHQKNPDNNKIKETKNYVIIITIKGVMNMEQEDILKNKMNNIMSPRHTRTHPTFTGKKNV